MRKSSNGPHSRMQGIPDNWTEQEVCEVCSRALALSVTATCCLPLVFAGLMMLSFIYTLF